MSGERGHKPGSVAGRAGLGPFIWGPGLLLGLSAAYPRATRRAQRLGLAQWSLALSPAVACIPRCARQKCKGHSVEIPLPTAGFV